MKQSILYFLFIYFLFQLPLHAQNKESTDSISVLTLKDSSVYKGELMLQRDSDLFFNVLNKGPMMVKNKDVVSLKKVLKSEDDIIAMANSDSLRIRPNVLFVELAGSSAGISINYCRTTVVNSSLNISFRTGIAVYPDDLFLGLGPLFGISADWFGPAHHLETGIGVSFYAGDKLLSAIIGYKYQKPNQGFYFRFSFTPVIVLQTGIDNIQPWAGISFGVAMK